MAGNRNWTWGLAALLALAAGQALGNPEIRLEQPDGAELVANRVVGFGSNSLGQTTIPPGLTGVVAIAAGENSSAALRIDGSVVGWGQVNNLPAFTGVEVISHGGFHGHGLKADGSLVSWGVAPPGPPTPPLGAVAASPGGWSAAIKNGALVTWGAGAPTAPAGNDFSSVAVGDFHLVALRASSPFVVAAGNNSDGQTTVPGVCCSRAVAAGRRFTLTLSTSGGVLQYGFNDNGGGVNAPVPAGLNGVVAISAQGHALALKSDGSVVGWGRGVEGQLSLPGGATAVRAIAAGSLHSLALAGSTLNYGNVGVGGPTATRTFVIRNTGTLPLSLSSVVVTGGQASQFIVDGTGLTASVPAGGQTSFSVRYQPTAAGAHRTMLRILNNDGDEATTEILLSGTGVNAPEMVVRGNGVVIVDRDTTPTLADHTDFDTRVLGDGLTRTYTVENVGSATLLLGAVQIDGPQLEDFHALTELAPSLAPGASTTVQVRFVPTDGGLRSARVILYNDDSDHQPYIFSVQGQGIEPEIDVSSAGQPIEDGGSTPIDFGTADIVGQTRVRSFTIDNLGAGRLDLGGISFSGAQAGDFSVSSAPPANIAPGASGNFEIRFDPAASGMREAVLHLANNDHDEHPFDVPLTGVGEAVDLAVSGNGTPIVSGDTTPNLADHTDFGTVDVQGEQVRRFVVRHAGSAGLLQFGAASIDGPQAQDFRFRVAPPASLAPGESSTLLIVYTPSATGVANATLHLASNDPDTPSFDFALRAVAAAPEIDIDLAGTPVRDATLLAWGDNQAGQSQYPSGLEGVVELSGRGYFTLARTRAGRVVAWGDNGLLQSEVPPDLRGVVAVSASRFHSVALRADGTVVAWGRNENGECEVGALRDIRAIAAGDRYTVAVRSDGTVLVLGANNFGQGDVPPGLDGVVAVAAGLGHVLALRMDGSVACWGANSRGQCAVPSTATQVTAIAAGLDSSLALRSDGTVLAWGRIVQQGHVAPQPAGGLAAIAVGVEHGLARSPDGVLHAWGLNDHGQAIVPSPLLPTGTVPVSAVSAGEWHSAAVIAPVLRFLSTQGGPGGPQTLTLRNSGSDPLAIDGFTLSGAHAADFSVDASGVPATLAPGAQATFTVSSLANSGGTRRANLRIRSNDADEAQFDMALRAEFLAELAVSGNGVDIVNGDVTPDRSDHTDFGSPVDGGPVLRTFTLRNLGISDLVLGPVNVTGQGYTLDAAPPALIPAGGSASFRVRFHLPQSSGGSFGGAVSIPSNDADENPFTFGLICTPHLQGPGDPDLLDAPVSGGSVLAISTQIDDRILIGGDFSQVAGLPRQGLARLHPDGSLDTAFDAGLNGSVHGIAVLDGGQLLIAGDFSQVGGVPRRHVARLQANGMLDLSFNPNPSAPVDRVVVEDDGRILLAGSFTSLQPNGSGPVSARPYLARVRTDGTVDDSFHPAPDGRVRTLALFDACGIVLGGDFQTLAPNGGTAAPRPHLACISPQGAVLPALDLRPDGIVRSLGFTPDLRLYVAGDFTTLRPGGGAPVARQYIAQLFDNGELYVEHPTTDGPVYSVIWTTYRTLLGGAFNQMFTVDHPPQVRHAFGGSIGRNLDPYTDLDVRSTSGTPLVSTIAVQRDGRILLGGRFDRIAPNGAPDPTARQNLARVLGGTPSNPDPRYLTVVQSGTLRWAHMQGAPPMQRALFDISVDHGQTWRALGAGRRIGNEQFELINPPLAASFQSRIRATSVTSSGSSMFEYITSHTGVAAPRIVVSGNGQVIANGDSTPDSADHTDFGTVDASSGELRRSFTLRNDGTALLSLGTVVISGAQAGDFSVTATPAASVAAGASTTVEIRFDPAAVGLRVAWIRIPTNDALAAPFDFAVQGTGQGPQATLPGAPAILTAVPLNAGARLSFSAATDGGSPILDYTASCTPGTASTTQNALSLDVTGLTNQTAYRCSVRARNAIGTGPASEALGVIPGSSGSSADVSISKTNATNFVNGGAPVVYTLVVANAGPAGVVGARVQDSIGPGTDFSAATWQCTASGGAACPPVASGSGSLDALVDLPLSGAVQWLFSATPNGGSETPVSNVAAVSPPAGTTDPNMANNVASDGPDLRGVFRSGFE